MLVPKLRFKREDGTEYPGWEEKTLQDVSSYITTTGIGEKSVYVGTENMRKDCLGVVLEDNNDTTVKGIQYALNDVLVSNIRPYLKKAWKADRSGICSTDVLCIRGTSGILSEYLYTLLSSDSFFEYVMQGVKGTKMPRGDKKHIMDMPVSIPCLEEQQKIADFLSTVDEVIAQSEAEVQNLEQQKKAAMQKIFSQEVRFKREDGTEYPGWDSDIVGNRIVVFDKKVSTDCTLPVLTSSKTNGIEYQSDHFGRVQNHDIDGYNLLPRGYATYRNRSDNRDFTFNINDICDEGIISKFYPVFTSNNCNLMFLIYLLNNSPTIVKEIGYTAIGTGQKVLSISDFKGIRILVPCLEEQQKIADFFSAYDEAINYAKQELDKWKELKKGLLQQMFV